MKKLIAYLFVATTLCLLMSSCASSRKSKVKEALRMSNEAAANSHNFNASKNDSLNLNSNDSSYSEENQIQVNFDNGFLPDSSNDVTDSPGVERVNDYEGAAVKEVPARVGKTKKMVFNYNIGGNEISSPVPVKSVNVINKKTGQVTALQIVQQNKSDTAVSDLTTTSKSETEIIKEVKNKETKSLFGLIILLCLALALLIGIWYLFIWRKKPPSTE